MQKVFYAVWAIIGIIILTTFAGCMYGCYEAGKALDETMTPTEIETGTPMDENIRAGIEMVTVDRTDVYKWVKTGMTKQQVLDKFGEPTKIQQMESDVSGMMEGMEEFDINVGSTKMELEYWYYGNVQIGFMNGKVSSKMSV